MSSETVNAENSIGPSFEVLQGDSLLLPYGAFGHRLGTQRVDRASGERMAAAMRGAVATVKRLLTTGARRLPIYIGHPDVPGRGAEFPDKRAYGWIDAIAAENDGIRLAVAWTAEGRRLIEEGHFRYYSPYWEAEQRGRELTPVELISVGLTNNPNIPVPPLANDGGDLAAEEGAEDQPEPEDHAMKKRLAELLGKDESATDDELLDEVAALREAAAKAAENEEEPDEEKGDDPDPDEEAEARAAENDRLLVRIREERAGAALDALCLAGRLAPAGRPDALRGLLACENDDAWAAELGRLNSAEPPLKTQGVTDGLAESGLRVRTENDEAARREERAKLVDAEMKANGGKFSAAWEKAARKHPELF